MTCPIHACPCGEGPMPPRPKEVLLPAQLTMLELAAVNEVRAKLRAEREDTKAAWTAAAEATDTFRVMWHKRRDTAPHVPVRTDSGAT